jgi:hypothetical protein
MTDGVSSVAEQEAGTRLKDKRWTSVLAESRLLAPGLVLALTFAS